MWTTPCLALSLFALRLFALGVGQARACLLQHLLLVLVHVDRVRTGGLGLDGREPREKRLRNGKRRSEEL